VNAAATPTADRIPRWDTRPRHSDSAHAELDFGTWHKDALSHDSYCMDVDEIEYRIDANGTLRVVGIYELIRWGWQHDLDDIPDRLAPYEGKVALLRRISASIAEGQGSSLPTFFVWHRPNLSEFVVCRLEDWAGGTRRSLGLRRKTFAELIRDLPWCDGDPVAPSSTSGREGTQ
jgi:hypothetical protein